MLFGGTGFFIDRFQAQQGEGIVWLHGYGNVFEKMLAPGEAIDIESGGWIYRDDSVQMNQQVYGLKTGLLGGSGQLVFNRFTGPGRVGIQSAYVHLPTEEPSALPSVADDARGPLGRVERRSRPVPVVRLCNRWIASTVSSLPPLR